MSYPKTGEGYSKRGKVVVSADTYDEKIGEAIESGQPFQFIWANNGRYWPHTDHMNVRPETRKRSDKVYYTAYRKRDGRTTKAYIGADPTLEKLQIARCRIENPDLTMAQARELYLGNLAED